MMIQSIDCTHARDLMIGALEGEVLSEPDHTTLDAHLAECAACRSYRQTMQHLAISLKSMPQVPAPAGLSERIMAQLAEDAPAAESAPSPHLSGGSAPVLLSQWRRYSPIAAAVLLVALALPLAFFSMRQGPYTNHTDQQLAQRTGSAIQAQQPPADGFRTDLQQPNGLNGMSPQPGAHGPIATQSSEGGSHSEGGSLSEGEGGNHAMSSTGPSAWSGGGATASSGNAASGNTGDAAIDASNAPGSELLAAADPSASMNSAVSGETESDLYYDPVSTLVGF